MLEDNLNLSNKKGVPEIWNALTIYTQNTIEIINEYLMKLKLSDDF